LAHQSFSRRIIGEKLHHEKEAKQLLPKEYQDLAAVGRLDKDSTGLLLFTDDGVVANRLTNPKFDHEKEYLVSVNKPLLPKDIAQYEKGITILGEKAKPVKVKQIDHLIYSFTLTEGKNRQVRRMLKNLGYHVFGLKRIRIVNLLLADLKPGESRILQRQDLDKSLL